MTIEALESRLQEHGDRDAIIWQSQPFSYRWVADSIERWRTLLSQQAVKSGSVVSLEADFSPTSVALLLALIDIGCTVVPLTSSVEPSKPEFRAIAEVEVTVDVSSYDEPVVSKTGVSATHECYSRLRSLGRPGLVLFSSGSTGKSKASVHDLVPLLKKFEAPRHAWRTITFLLFDHIGGFNTLLYTLFNGGCVVTVGDRSPESVCSAIEQFAVELLPTSPTFLNLLLISEAYTKYDLSSLKLVTYGTEVMPESTLERFCRLFPDVRMLQTYGLSEVGILRSKSKSSDSLWVKVGGEGYETRVVDGLLEIKAESAMLGYLNAPSPFTDDGWFKTGDVVEVDGEYFRFKGRKEEIINVGGEKVYPAEVESVLQMMDGVSDVVVSGEPNAITGQIVKARVSLSSGESGSEFRRRMREFCGGHLADFKIPQKVVLVEGALHGDRFKKLRLDR
jgi:acyl-coenzyme A synthetase/AMP-(fatty) acid ligase